jgi:hypothetical protein
VPIIKNDLDLGIRKNQSTLPYFIEPFDNEDIDDYLLG